MTTDGRRLILCLDGTWNSPTNERAREDGSRVFKPTNTLKLCRAIVPFADKQQITYYDIGVGSLAQYAGTPNWLLYQADRVLGGAWGAGFEGNVEDALHFLTLNHREGDEVFLFGFSRGAATARAVTRFLEWSGGVLPKRDAYYLPHFFRGYIESHGDAAKRDELLRKYPVTFVPVRVKYLGVWDTVASLGSRFRATGHETSPSGLTFHMGKAPAACVENARQALAIDEKRFDFRPEVWTARHSEQQNVEQKWFAGVHTGVGGGQKKDGLANIALRWILHGAEDCDLAVDKEFLRPYQGRPDGDFDESWSWFYKGAEAIRFRYGKGRREIHGFNAELHYTVIERMHKCPDYRPENVLEYLASHADLSRYRELPPDVEESIEKLRKRRPANAITVRV